MEIFLRRAVDRVARPHDRCGVLASASRPWQGPSSHAYWISWCRNRSDEKIIIPGETPLESDGPGTATRQATGFGMGQSDDLVAPSGVRVRVPGHG